jgi:hypothetical protein
MLGPPPLAFGFLLQALLLGLPLQSFGVAAVDEELAGMLEFLLLAFWRRRGAIAARLG